MAMRPCTARGTVVWAEQSPRADRHEPPVGTADDLLPRRDDDPWAPRLTSAAQLHVRFPLALPRRRDRHWKT
ncbi:hypothetical protein ACIRU3_10530 [Streptomyces sp. NPDC101151]|uniref:hypothetical protein n=1 Tax=Streptomyces sp. NPDC101151 TaxID=3366115 RepID=UPI0038235F92